jgi:hypothetical protein
MKADANHSATTAESAHRAVKPLPVVKADPTSFPLPSGPQTTPVGSGGSPPASRDGNSKTL